MVEDKTIHWNNQFSKSFFTKYLCLTILNYQSLSLRLLRSWSWVWVSLPTFGLVIQWLQSWPDYIDPTVYSVTILLTIILSYLGSEMCRTLLYMLCVYPRNYNLSQSQTQSGFCFLNFRLSVTNRTASKLSESPRANFWKLITMINHIQKVFRFCQFLSWKETSSNCKI